MFKTILILSVIALAMSSSIPPQDKSNVLVQVVTQQEMDNLLKQNPQAQPLSREVSEKSQLTGQTRDIIRYTVGSRQSGDQLVAYDSGSNSWSSPQNVRLRISYPEYGTGAIVTYMVIEVNQSNNLGRAYVTAGGVGFRYITVVVEAQSTLWFDWVHNIYGR